MDLIADLPVIGGLLISVIGFVLVLGIVVFVHEYGHYIVGRWCGIHADTFSMGFGPVMRSWYDKRGTKWQVAAFPLGGYVKFLGDADGSSRTDYKALDGMADGERARSFPGAALYKRALTVAAGPFFNFFLSIAIFAGVVAYQGIPLNVPVIGEIDSHPALETGLQPGDTVLSVNGTPVETFGEIFTPVRQMERPGPVTLEVERGGTRQTVTAPYLFPPLVGNVEIFSAASRAGLKEGDLILSIDGTPISSFEELRQTVLATSGESLAFTVARGTRTLDLAVTPKVVEYVNPNDLTVEKRVMIGVGSTGILGPSTRTPGPWESLSMGTTQVITIIDRTFWGLAKIVQGVLSPANLQGPVGIAQMSGDQVSKGWLDAIVFIGIISTAIGLLNLFPIPVLDGGHLLMFAYEAVAGRPPAESVMRVAMTLGLSMVLLLMVFATYNDLVRLFVS